VLPLFVEIPLRGNRKHKLGLPSSSSYCRLCLFVGQSNCLQGQKKKLIEYEYHKNEFLHLSTILYEENFFDDFYLVNSIELLRLITSSIESLKILRFAVKADIYDKRCFKKNY
jgi:hypothetical protein